MGDRDNLSSGQRNGRRRNRGRSGNGQRRPRVASAKYRRKIEEKLFGKKGDRARLRLTERLREAHGTPGFQRVFREYVRGYGLPENVDLLTLLLDLGEERDIVAVLGGIEEVRETISPEEKSLLRMRLRNLEMATEFDGVADATVELLDRL